MPNPRRSSPALRRPIGLALAVLVLLAGLPSAATAASAAPATDTASDLPHLTRLAGPTRTLTAAAVAAAAHPDGAREAIVVAGDRYTEALPGAALAGLLGAPILLTAPTALDDATATALRDLGVERVTLLGDDRAVSPAVEQALAALADVRRIGGIGRADTAALIAEEVVRLAGGLREVAGRRTVLLASAEDFPDALAASGPAHAAGVPLLLTRRDQLTPRTRGVLQDLRPDEVVVFGGEAAIASPVTDAVAALGITVRRLAGASRTGTAVAAADHFAAAGLFDGDVAILARGDTFPDDLAAAALAGRHRAPILLTATPDVLSAETQAWLAARCPVLRTLVVVGGPAAVSEPVAAAARAAAGCQAPPATSDPAAPGVADPATPPGADPADPAAPAPGNPPGGTPDPHDPATPTTPPSPPAPTPGHAAAYPGQPVPGTVRWGAAVGGNTDPTDRHETPAGHPLALRRTFFQWNQRTTGLIRTVTDDHANGRLPWVSLKTPGWAAMAAGTHDHEIDQLLRDLDATGHPVWLTIHHEPEGGGGINAPDDPAGPTGHLAMNQRVRQRMTALGTTHIALAAIFMDWTFDPRSGRDITQWWAPDTYDILGIDTYRHQGGSLITPTWLHIRRWAADHHVDIAVGEWGTRGSDPTAADHVREWYDHATTSHTDGHGARVVGLAAFDSGLNSPGGSWELTGHQLTTFHTLLTDPRTARG